jgi:hypothetical protein
MPRRGPMAYRGRGTLRPYRQLTPENGKLVGRDFEMARVEFREAQHCFCEPPSVS